MIARLKRWVAMPAWLKRRIRIKKLQLAARWADEAGLCVVRIVSMAGTDYIYDSQGRCRKIGK